MPLNLIPGDLPPPEETYPPGEAWRTDYPFAPNWLTLPGGHRLHYVDEPGAGTPVVMVHGNPTWSFYYRGLIRALNGEHRCIAPDNLGCGLSDKPQDWPYQLAGHIENLERLLIGHLKLEKFSLVLHDWGGAIGMGVATRHPERIDKLVILNTAAFHLPDCPWRIRLCRIPGFGALAVRGLNLFVKAALRMAAATPLSDTARAGLAAPYGSWHDRIAVLRFVQDIPMNPGHPTWRTLETIEQALPSLAAKPALIVWGAKDFCFHDRFLARWRNLFPKATCHRFAHAGHYVLEDAATQILPLIRQFLSEV
ncbi:MAG: alpha/beta fold hydrolase [Lentisphaeria bacterium]|jgi:haloalkane dehalogenase